jgi:hypothetical protein
MERNTFDQIKVEKAIKESLIPNVNLDELALKYEIPKAYLSKYRIDYFRKVLKTIDDAEKTHSDIVADLTNRLAESDAKAIELANIVATQKKSLDSTDATKNNMRFLLPISIIALTMSSVMSSGMVITKLFHDNYIGYPVAFVFCNTPLVLILLKKLDLTWGKIVIGMTLFFEIICNLYNIQLNMEGSTYNNVEHRLGLNPFYLSLMIGTLLPIVACLLEYLWLRDKDK